MCTAGGERVTPGEDDLREFCNLGYARQCARIPADRRSDAVRFSIARDGGDRILLQYSCERDHAPIQHGQLQFDCISHAWPVAHPDSCIQRQAECYVELYLERRKA
jgi:hypothetical protein